MMNMDAARVSDPIVVKKNPEGPAHDEPASVFRGEDEQLKVKVPEGWSVNKQNKTSD